MSLILILWMVEHRTDEKLINRQSLIKRDKKQTPIIYQIKYPSDLIPRDSYIEVSTSFLCFIVLKSIEEKPMTKLCPFAIERFPSANVASRSVKTAGNNNLIVEVTKKKYVDLLKMTTLHNMKIKAYPYRSLKTSQGVMKFRTIFLLHQRN